MNFKSIKSKIAFSAGAGLLITAAILVGYSISSNTVNNRFINQTVSSLVERITLDKMQSVAAEYAQSISRRLEKGMQTAQTLADAAQWSSVQRRLHERVQQSFDPDGVFQTGRKWSTEPSAAVA